MIPRFICIYKNEQKCCSPGHIFPKATLCIRMLYITTAHQVPSFLQTYNSPFHFLPIQEYGREIPRRCVGNIFQGSQGLKLFFQGGQGKFSRGIIQVRACLPVGSYLENCFPMGHFWYNPPPGIPAQKQI